MATEVEKLVVTLSLRSKKALAGFKRVEAAVKSLEKAVNNSEKRTTRTSDREWQVRHRKRLKTLAATMKRIKAASEAEQKLLKKSTKQFETEWSRRQKKRLKLLAKTTKARKKATADAIKLSDRLAATEVRNAKKAAAAHARAAAAKRATSQRRTRGVIGGARAVGQAAGGGIGGGIGIIAGAASAGAAGGPVGAAAAAAVAAAFVVARAAINATISALKTLIVVVQKAISFLVKLPFRIARAFSSAFKTVGNVIKDVGSSIQALAQKMRRVGFIMSIFVTGPLVALGKASVSSFAGFNKAMVSAGAIMRDKLGKRVGITSEMFGKMRKAALELSTSGKALQAPEEMARSFFFLASAGLNAEQSIGALPIVANFATAGMFDMAEATELLTDAQSALGLKVGSTAQRMKNMRRVADSLVAANSLADATTREFAVALTTKAAAALKFAGKSVEEGSAILAVYADQGVKAELAGNALDRTLRLLGKGSINSTKEWERLNFTIFDGQGKWKNMSDIIGNLETVLDGLSPKQKIANLALLGFEARVQQVIIPLIGTSKLMREYETRVKAMGEESRKVAEIHLKSFSGQMEIFKNRLTAVRIEIGKLIAPTLLELNKRIEMVLNFWKGLSTETKKLVIRFATFVAAIGPVLLVLSFVTGIVGSLVFGFGSLLTMIGAIISPIGLLLSGLALMAAAMIDIQFQFTSMDMGDLFEGVVEGGKKALRFIKGFVTNFKENKEILFKWLKEKWNGVKEKILGVWTKIKAGVVKVLDFLTGNGNTFIKNFFGFFANFGKNVVAIWN